MSKTTIKKVKLSDIELNPDNPRTISRKDMEKLERSIEGFTKMLRYRPIIYDKNKVIIGGNMRFLALKKLGYKEVPETWLKCADDFSEEEKRQFVIVDNGSFGQWDFDMLANSWDDLPLADFGVCLPEDWLNGSDSLLDPGGPSNLNDNELISAKMAIPKEVWFDSKDNLVEKIEQICAGYGVTMEWPT